MLTENSKEKRKNHKQNRPKYPRTMGLCKVRHTCDENTRRRKNERHGRNI
jgi:hypothetical protein